MASRSEPVSVIYSLESSLDGWEPRFATTSSDVCGLRTGISWTDLKRPSRTNELVAAEARLPSTADALVDLIVLPAE